MAFCTTCGASVQGAFCPQCGTPLSAAGAQAAPPQYAQSVPAAAPVAGVPGAVAPARKHGPLFWILISIAGLFVLFVVALVGLIGFGVHKARQAGLDPELMQRNPAYAAAKMAIALNPDVEEISHNDGAGTMTVRDRKTGKTSTISFADVKNGHFSFTATDDEGKTATVDIGGSVTLPSWVPQYPGATQQGNLSVKGTDENYSEGGTVTFMTSDSASKVLSFYQDKAKDMGLKVATNTTNPSGGMVVLNDENDMKSLSVIAGGEGGRTSITLTYGVKKE